MQCKLDLVESLTNSGVCWMSNISVSFVDCVGGSEESGGNKKFHFYFLKVLI